MFKVERQKGQINSTEKIVDEHSGAKNAHRKVLASIINQQMAALADANSIFRDKVMDIRNISHTYTIKTVSITTIAYI